MKRRREVQRVSTPSNPPVWARGWQRLCQFLATAPTTAPTTAAEPVRVPEVTAAQRARAAAYEAAARQALRRGQAAEAQQLAEQCVALDPSNLLGHYHLGQALARQSDLAAARAAYDQARPYAGALGLVEQWLATLESVPETAQTADQ